MPRRNLTKLLVALALWLTPSLSSAATPTPEEWYATGMAHMKAKRFAKAANAFEEAYKLDENPILLWNMGRAYEEAGELETAKARYETLVKQEGLPEKLLKRATGKVGAIKLKLEEAKEKEELAKREAELAKQMEEKLTRELEKKQESERERERERLKEELRKEFAAELEKQRKLYEAALAKARAEAKAAGAEEAEKDKSMALIGPAKKTDEPKPATPMNDAGIATLVVGAVLAGAGIGLAANASSLRSEVEDAKSDAAAHGGVTSTMTRQDALANQSDADLQATLGYVGIALGAASLVTGIVLLAVGDDEPPATTVSTDVARGGGLVLRVGGSF